MREKDRENKRDRSRERGRKRIPSRLHSVGKKPEVGLQLLNREIMTKSWKLNLLSYPRALYVRRAPL